jgi:hypothetical protein
MRPGAYSIRIASDGVRTSVTLQGGVTVEVPTPIADAISASLVLRARNRVGTVRCPSLKTVMSNSPSFSR